jgi:predicted nucleotidyltransferase
MGQLGCKLSHVSVIKDAFDAGHENVLILEDDAVLSGSVFDLLTASDFGPWHFFYLGVRHKLPPADFKSDCDLLVRGYQTHAYVANRSIYEFILENALSSGLEIDVFYSTMIHPLGKSYVIKPQMGVQRTGDVSDIYNK